MTEQQSWLRHRTHVHPKIIAREPVRADELAEVLRAAAMEIEESDRLINSARNLVAQQATLIEHSRATIAASQRTLATFGDVRPWELWCARGRRRLTP
jgi:hypothetical protein